MAYSIDRMPERISIGRETETGVTDVMIDCDAWVRKWPGMALHAIHTPEGGAPYILQTETDGSVLVWHVTDADTATPGTGLVEIVGETNGRRKVSAMVKVSVAARMSGTVGEPPEAAKPWADRVVEAAERITGMHVQAETLDAGIGATAAWDGEQGLLTIGVPKGEKGPQGEKGEPGKDAVVDATLTQSGQAADAKATGGAIGQLKGDFDTCFDGGTIVEEFAEANQIKAPESALSTAEYGDDGSCTINANGYNCYFGWKFDTVPGEEYDVALDASKAFAEMFIVSETYAGGTHIAELTLQGTVYAGKFTAKKNVSTVFVYARYDSNITVIKSLNMSHTVPRTLKENAISTSSVPADGDIRPITSDAVSKAISSIAYIKNIIPDGVIEKHGYINHTSGEFVSYSGDNAYVGISDYIQVIGGSRISISAKSALTGIRSGLTLHVIAFYDADKKFISSLGNFKIASTTVQTDGHRYVDIPDNASYIRFNFYLATAYYDGIFTDFQVEYGEYWTDYSRPQEFIPKRTKSHWNSKKWVAIGDSITARAGNYVQTVATNLGLVATNAGISGAGARTMRECFSDPASSDYHQEWHDAIVEADLVTIYGCINNFGVSAEPIGDLYNSAEGTFIYQFKQLIDAVFGVNPDCRLIIIGTHNAWDDGSGYLPGIYQPCGSGTDTVAEYVEAVGRVARYYGCPFIDMYHLSGFNQYNGAKYLADSLHPNSVGYDRIAKILIEEIDRVQD